MMAHQRNLRTAIASRWLRYLPSVQVEIGLPRKQRKIVYMAHIWMTCICTAGSTEQNHGRNYRLSGLVLRGRINKE